MAAYSYFWDKIDRIPEIRWVFNLDSYVYEDYASQLIPRAVGYAAGLLNYFFRGDMDMIPDEEAGSGYVIVNKSEEEDTRPLRGSSGVLLSQENGLEFALGRRYRAGTR